MTWTTAGHGALIVCTCIGAAAGAVAAADPKLAVPGGIVAAACMAVAGVLGRYLPSASASVNVSAVANATPEGMTKTVIGAK